MILVFSLAFLGVKWDTDVYPAVSVFNQIAPIHLASLFVCTNSDATEPVFSFLFFFPFPAKRL